MKEFVPIIMVALQTGKKTLFSVIMAKVDKKEKAS